MNYINWIILIISCPRNGNLKKERRDVTGPVRAESFFNTSFAHLKKKLKTFSPLC